MKGELFTKINKLCFHRCINLYLQGFLFISIFLSNSSSAQESVEHDGFELLLEQAAIFITSQSNIPEGEPILTAPDSRIEIPECISGYIFSFPFTSKTSLRVSCSSQEWSIFLQVSYLDLENVPTFSKDLEAGSLLRKSDITNGDLVENEWLGHFIKTSVRSGQRFNEALLDDVVLVYKLTQDINKGDLITPSTIEQELLPASLHQNKLHDKNEILNAKALRALATGHELTRNDLLPLHRVLQVKTPVSRGTIIDANMILLADFWGRVPTDVLTDPDQLPHAVATTQLIPGQALRLSHLRTVPAIQKGQAVNVNVDRGQISISTLMIAESSAEIGQRIRLRNNESGKVVEGIVTAVGFATLP